MQVFNYVNIFTPFLGYIWKFMKRLFMNISHPWHKKNEEVTKVVQTYL